MIMNGLMVLIVLGIAYGLGARGFYSALLTLASVLVAGAVAFAVWEPLAIYLLDGLNIGFFNEAAWGLALVVPYAVTLGALQAALSAVLRANVNIKGPADLIGGLVCGLGSGIITAGVISIALAGIRTPGDYMGHTPITYDKGGSLVRTAPLWVPVDKLVSRFYSQLSETTLRTNTPLAKWYPDLADRGHLIRIGPEGQTLRTVIRPTDVKVVGRYTVGQDTTIASNQLTTASLDERIQKLRTIDGDDVGNGQYQIEGYVVQNFGGMREKGGQVVFGPGQLTLLCRDNDDTQSIALQPFAMASQAQGDQLFIGRWRFDGEKVFLASVGGAADPVMAFEFLMPKGYKPLALFIRGIRYPLADDAGKTVDPFEKFASVADRDAAVRSRDLFESASAVALDTGSASVLNTRDSGGAGAEIRATNRLRANLMKGQVGNLLLDDKNKIISGEALLRNDQLPERGAERTLLVEQILVDNTVVIVQVDVGSTSSLAITGAESEGDGAPALFDENQQRYDAVGYFYKDAGLTRVRFTPDSPLKRSDLPSMSRSRTDQQLTLIFRCSLGVKITSYAIGTKVIRTLQPPLSLENSQAGR